MGRVPFPLDRRHLGRAALSGPGREAAFRSTIGALFRVEEREGGLVVMRRRVISAGLVFAVGLWLVPGGAGRAPASAASSSASTLPTWWAKYQTLLHESTDPAAVSSGPALAASTNVDVSNEDGPQSETSITV